MSITSFERSEPHSNARSACFSDGSGWGCARGSERRSGCSGDVINAPLPLRAAYSWPMNGAKITPTTGSDW